jgi:streptomycin 6-kinase
MPQIVTPQLRSTNWTRTKTSVVDNTEMQSRVADRLAAWQVSTVETRETNSSTLVFGHRQQQPVVVKILKSANDEWFSGSVLDSFGGQAVVRVLDYSDGALLLEHLRPGRTLAETRLADDEATAIIAGVIWRMTPGFTPATAPLIETFASAFERHQGAGPDQVPRALIEAAHSTYVRLCASQTSTRLLHGDLHHHNILFDDQHGWVAIDPKGVVGELAYEAGAALRNPAERPELFTAPHTILMRSEHFASVLNLVQQRVLGWAFAQAVLAALSELEDDRLMSAGRGWIALASAIRPMLEGADF